MGKEIIYDIEALLKVKQGVEKMVKEVNTDYGPVGRNVVFEDHGKHIITKDGITVAEHIDLQDPFENMGAQLIRQVSKQTAEKAGGGTTTVAILAGQLLAEGIRLVASGANPIDLQKGIFKAHDIARKKLSEISKPVDGNEDLKNIAVISVNNDIELGSLIAEAFKKRGKETLVQVQEGKSVNTTIEFVEGVEMEGGFLSTYFVTDSSKNEAVLENALVFITSNRISSTNEILPLLIQIAEDAKPVLIIAKDFDSDVLSMLATNNRNNALKCVAVKSTLAGDSLNELLEDISLVTGTEVFSGEKGQDLKTVHIGQLGTVDKVVVSSTKTRILSGKNKNSSRLAEFINLLQNKRQNNTFKGEHRNIEARLARLTGGVVVISIGAATETELKEKLCRVNDGVKAVKAALEEGVVPGGGIIWLQLAKHLETITSAVQDEQRGITIFKKALTAPFIILGKNAGKESLPLLERMMQAAPEIGYDFREDQIVNVWEKGIIDPAKVIRVAMEGAVSVVSELLKTKAAIAEVKNNNNKKITINTK